MAFALFSYVQPLFWIGGFVYLFFPFFLCANPPPTNLQRSLSYLSHHVSNHEAELLMLKERIHNQELIIEALREEVLTLIKATKEQNSKSLSSWDHRLIKIEKAMEKWGVDLKQFKEHANETFTVLTEQQKKMNSLEEIHKIQSHQLEQLENALRGLAEAMQGKTSLETAKASSIDASKITLYKVKGGDSLEKIAKTQGTTVHVLREANHLETDQIRIGQELKIPH